jgi:hypothetical protein
MPGNHHHQRGQGMVEFALIAPFFILLLLSVVEVGLYMQAQSTIDTVTREVARAVAICGTTQGPWRYQQTAPATNPATFTQWQDCKAAAVAQEHLYYLPISAQSTLTLAVCSGPNILPNGHCNTASTGANTTAFDQPTYVGEPVEIDVYYNYRYYIDPLMGEVAPSTVMASSAYVVAQQ